MEITFADCEGNVALWEAILGGHESVTKILIENGATLKSGNVGQYACTAVEQNNLDLLKRIIRYGRDITLPSANLGTTALHVAVSEDNVDMVKFLLAHKCDMDLPDQQGWTPRALADQQGHHDIKAIFDSLGEPKPKSEPMIAIPMPESTRKLGRFTSEPTMPLSSEGVTWDQSQSQGRSRPRRRTNNFHNSLFGMMTAAHKGEKEEEMVFRVSNNNVRSNVNVKARVTITCPEKGEGGGKKLVLLPGSLKELIEMGANKFGGFHGNVKVFTWDGAQIDDVDVVRDGDLLVFVTDDGGGGTPQSNSN